MNEVFKFRLLSLLLLVLALNGCSLKLQIALFNNTGESIAIQLGAQGVDVRQLGFVKFDYPGEAQSWVLHLSAGKCDYVYRVPSSLAHYPVASESTGVVKVQLERNFGMFLLPPDASGVADVSNLNTLQKDGFPLQPIDKACRT